MIAIFIFLLLCLLAYIQVEMDEERKESHFKKMRLMRKQFTPNLSKMSNTSVK